MYIVSFDRKKLENEKKKKWFMPWFLKGKKK